jgi:hypothetical protein
MPIVLADGTVIASFVDDTWIAPYFERRHAWIMRSTDGATTFSAPLFVNQACGPPPGFQLSAFAVDRSETASRDRLYFACRQNAGGPVLVFASGDRGDSWNRPGVVVGLPGVDAAARRVMSLSVNKNGVLGVMIVERRAQSGGHCLEVSFAASRDRGATFTPPEPVSSSSCGDSPNDTVAWRRYPTYGDYFGLVSTPDGRFHLMWSEMRGGASALLATTVAVDGARIP